MLSKVLLFAVLLAVVGVFKLIQMIGWLIMQLASLVVDHWLIVTAVMGAIIALGVWATRHTAKELEKAAPDIHAFVAAYLSDSTDPSDVEIPTEDVKALQSILQRYNIDLDLQALGQAVQRERLRQLEQRRAAVIESVTPDVQSFVSAYLSRTNWSPCLTLPQAEVTALEEMLTRKQIYIGFPDLGQVIQSELARQMDDWVWGAIRDRHEKDPTALTALEWAEAYADVFDERDDCIPCLTRLMNKAGHHTTEASMLRAIKEARASALHKKRVDAVARAMNKHRQ